MVFDENKYNLKIKGEHIHAKAEAAFFLVVRTINDENSRTPVNYVK